MSEIVFMNICYGMNNVYELFRIKRDSTLLFKIHHTLQGKNVRLFTNYPIGSKTFIRSKYSEIVIKNPTLSQNQNDSFDNHGELKLELHGAFQFYFTENGTNKIGDKIGEGYFIVDPIFTKASQTNSEQQFYELNSLTVQTYLGKNLGYFDKWIHRLNDAIDAKYNMIHFTPLQELGGSRSAYSLKDQLTVNPEFSKPDQPPITWTQIADFVDNLYKEHNIMSMTDLVLNHTAYNSPWLHEHPECAYNVVNSPHLRPAYLIDRVVYELNLEVAANKYVSDGLSNHVDSEHHVNVIQQLLWKKLGKLRLEEFYVAHIDNVVNSFKTYLDNGNVLALGEHLKAKELKLLHGNYHRLKSTVDFNIAAAKFYNDSKNKDSACNQLRECLARLNSEMEQAVKSHLEAAVTNVLANVRWRFVDGHGEKLKIVTADSPLMWFYFYQPKPNKKEIVSLADCEALMNSESHDANRIMAYNGWVIGDDPLRNFAEEQSNVYLRRELVVWGDSVKLRYGEKPEDCPFLWNIMSQYAEETARIFHAVRLDNCHSIQIQAAQAFLDRARAVNPNLYIMAELFTGSSEVDNAFVNRLGINSLVRESHHPGNCRDLGALMYKYGTGLPMGSFLSGSRQNSHTNMKELLPSQPHAIVYDRTHDNRSAIEDRSPFDVLPTAGILSMSCCTVGSTWGYDQMVPGHINVVTDERMYPSGDDGNYNTEGIVHARGLLNALHTRLATEKYTESFIDQLDDDVIAMTRSCPGNSRSIVLVAHSCFRYPDSHRPQHRPIKSMEVNGEVKTVLFEIWTCRDEELIDSFKCHQTKLNGLPGMYTEIKQDCTPTKARSIQIVKLENGHDQLVFMNLPPGSVVAVEVELTHNQQNVIAQIKSSVDREFGQGPFHSIISSQNCTLSDLSTLMYRCHPEEAMETNHEFNTYQLPGNTSTPLVYCGIQGCMSLLDRIRLTNDLGHPLCGNLRCGNWLMEYLVNRLDFRKQSKVLPQLAAILRQIFDLVGQLPRYLVPCYFDLVLTGAYSLVMDEIHKRLGERVVSGSNFVKLLATNSVILCSSIKNLQLPPICVPEDKKETDAYKERCSLSAGFPHFAEGIWRNWGRDTFIALRGLLLLIPSRLDDAEQVILSYAGVMRHGLIPNLLSEGGRNPRFNARDATWFWLEAIKQFEKMRPVDHPSILHRQVQRLYPNDCTTPVEKNTHITTVQEVVQEILQSHATGIKFWEANAGSAIDSQMQWDGFLVEAGIRPHNKFVYGGSVVNCGTWMDKMGSSERAGNKGKPATPRDGSAVELVGLCASVLSFLDESHSANLYAYEGVQFQGSMLTWRDWYNTIQEHFDNNFFIPIHTAEPHLKYNAGIYRDSVESTLKYTDNQFRPNFLIAMTVAPDIFDTEHAWHALSLVEKKLLGPLGMKTLCDNDLNYRGYYDNSNDSTDGSVAEGFNYHQGPEWVWLLGYYLRARLVIVKKMMELNNNNNANNNSANELYDYTLSHVKQVLGKLHDHITYSEWKSLPELTNRNGEYCHHSCAAQAWSVATMYESVNDMLDAHNQ